MARGGIYDQLAGGFARYAVDAAWVVPHFEKMLYDNAPAAARLRPPVAGDRRRRWPQRVARETADFLLRDLRTPEGGFASALDADTDGVEGLTYAWTPAQLDEVLGADDGERAAALLRVTRRAPSSTAASTLQLPRRPRRPGALARVRGRLLAARARGPSRPGTTRWSRPGTGWPIAALAEAGALLELPG